MIAYIIKYFAMVLCSLFVYRKLLCLPPQSAADRVAGFLFSLILAAAVSITRRAAAPLSMLIIVCFLTLFAIKHVQSPLNLAITTSILSLAISYAAFLLSSIMLLPVGYMINVFVVNQDLFDAISFLCIGVLQFLLLLIPFRLKRLRRGMPFLLRYGDSDIGVYIASSLLLATSFFSADKGANRAFIIPIAFIAICGLILFFWWRSRLTRTYIECAKDRELQELLADKDERIAALEYHNAELSKIIHRDNKLIPAMAFAVRECITDSALGEAKREALLSQLETATAARRGILKDYETQGKTLPTTTVSGIDSLLSYFYHKAATNGIGFDVSLSGNVKYLIETTINEEDLKTLLADLIENACIAVRSCERKTVLARFGIVDGSYAVDILDSGTPFQIDVLLRMGREQITTHADTGGSGIGMMTTAERLKKYRASFILEEFSDNHIFTKRVSISFDGLSEYRVKTHRKDLSMALSAREDVRLLPAN
ncbi:MAG: hypothetical protein RR502_02850 [Oscillospiraceae bacterium]